MVGKYVVRVVSSSPSSHKSPWNPNVTAVVSPLALSERKGLVLIKVLQLVGFSWPSCRLLLGLLAQHWVITFINLLQMIGQ